uniref:E3 ubiquitin-protein ligase RNF144A n=1 Tax=Canis lupus familiaris TaxID=9615 RepID=A0A8C0NI47_CANLF
MTTARYRPTWDLALDPLVSCKLCLGEYPVEQMTTIAQCQCIFCTLCLKQYVELLIKEGLETAISCPDAACPKQGHLQEDEIECMVAAEIMQRYKKLQFEREVLLDPCRTWCPASTCQAVCQLQEMGLQTPQLVQCKACAMEFCSACKASWHPGQGCPETMPITFLPGETSSAFKLEEDDAPIKRCPKCKVYIERDEGCAQMMCKNCKHAFCWYCLESLDDDFLLIHYDKGPCRNKLGHSRASVIWHRTQVWLFPCVPTPSAPGHTGAPGSSPEMRAGHPGAHRGRWSCGPRRRCGHGRQDWPGSWGNRPRLVYCSCDTFSSGRTMSPVAFHKCREVRRLGWSHFLKT